MNEIVEKRDQGCGSFSLDKSFGSDGIRQGHVASITKLAA